MSPPIRDGSGNDIGAIRLGDGSEISEIRTGGGDVLFQSVSTEEDSWSLRDGNSNNVRCGFVLKPKTELTKIEVSLGGSGKQNYDDIFIDGSFVANASEGDTVTINQTFDAGVEYFIETDANYRYFGGGKSRSNSLFDITSSSQQTSKTNDQLWSFNGIKVFA